MVRTERHPEDIISEVMNFADKEIMIKHLSNYQKSKPDWDTFRRKIPDNLLEKWAKVLRECRKYGFIAPKIQNEEMVWKRVMGRRSNIKNVNQCTLCPSSQRAGDCRGREKKVNNQTMFKPCWE
jgi:hypothetical protein